MCPLVHHRSLNQCVNISYNNVFVSALKLTKSQFFTFNSRVLYLKRTSFVCAIRLEVNEQLIPTGSDLSRQIAATECVDQWSCGISSVVNVDFVTTTTAAFWEREVDEFQVHTL